MRWKSLCRPKFVLGGLATLLLTGTFAASPVRASASEPVAASEWNFQKEATGLLGEVKALAYNLERDTDTLSALASTSAANWRSHAHYLNSVRNDVNKIGERLDRLQTIKHVTAPWQQQAIDRIVPIGVDVASRTDAAIEHLNGNHLFLFADSYRDHLNVMADRSAELRLTVAQFIDYGQSQQRMDRLQQQLELPSL